MLDTDLLSKDDECHSIILGCILKTKFHTLPKPRAEEGYKHFHTIFSVREHQQQDESSSAFNFDEIFSILFDSPPMMQSTQLRFFVVVGFGKPMMIWICMRGC